VTERPQLRAQTRTVTGKEVARLRREGRVPAVLYGNGEPSVTLDVDAKEFELLRRRAGRNALVDLSVGDGGRARPVMLHAVQEHPVTRMPIHIDLLVVNMREETTVELPLTLAGEAPAAKAGATILQLLAQVKVRALPGDLPHSVEVDVSGLDSFETVLHASDISLPPGVTMATDPLEPVARVMPPRIEAEDQVALDEEMDAAEAGGATADEPGQEPSEGDSA
jgi:large subunit ribosomal protein L25